MSDDKTTCGCPLCHASGYETCLVQRGETCLQPWRPKGPLPALNPVGALRSMWSAMNSDKTTTAKCELCDDPAACDRHGRCLEFEADGVALKEVTHD